MENRILALLTQGNWQQDHDLIRGLKTWPQYPLLLQAYRTLDERALFQSWVHGPGHPPGPAAGGPHWLAGGPGRGDAAPALPGGQLPRRGPDL